MLKLKLEDSSNARLSSFILDRLSDTYRDKVDTGLEYWLTMSEKYYYGRYSEEYEDALLTTFKTYIPNLNLLMPRVRTLQAVFLDHRFNTQNKPFTITPSPISKLSYSDRSIIADDLMNNFRVEDFINSQGQSAMSILQSPGFDKLVNQYALAGKEVIKSYAKKAAQGMEQVMSDQLIESNFKDNVFSNLIANISKYPMCIAKGPSFMPDTNTLYSGNRVSLNRGMTAGFESINPWNIYFKNDANVLHKSSCVIDVSYHNQVDFAAIMNMQGMAIYDKDRLKCLLDKFNDESTISWFNWDNSAWQYRINIPSYLSRSPMIRDGLWCRPSQIPKVNMTISMTGYQLKKIVYGQSDTVHKNDKQEPPKAIQDDKAYHLRCEMVGYEVILCTIDDYQVGSNGYYSSSFVNDADNIVGQGMCELIKPSQDAVNDWFISMCRNIQWETRPLTQVDVSRLADGSKNKLPFQPGDTVEVNTDALNMNPNSDKDPAVRRLDPQSGDSVKILNIITAWMRRVDELTGITGTLSGNDRSASDARVGTVYTTKLSTAMKPIQLMANDFDINCIEPMMRNLYKLNMKYHYDDSIKGDSTLSVEGATGMLRRNLKQEATQYNNALISQGVDRGLLDPINLREFIVESLYDNGYDLTDKEIDRHISNVPEGQEILNQQGNASNPDLDGRNLNPVGATQIPEPAPNVQTVNTPTVIDNSQISRG